MILAKYLFGIWVSIAPAVGNHLWQSTVFAVVAGLLTLVLRKNQARARYWIWMAASLKFLIPLSLLVGIGGRLGWLRTSDGIETGFSFAMDEFSQPFAQPTLPVKSHVAAAAASPLAGLWHLLPAIAGTLWLCGFVAVLFTWAARWWRMSSALRDGSPLHEGREVKALRRLERVGGIRQRIEIFLSRVSLEPGIFGIARPILVWPEGISARLDDAHVKAILAHEIGHVRRRDNLFASIHMLVEAIFWFHPLVWFLGTRLVEEREVACDEEVLELGSERQVYAESILKICEFCVGSPLACVSGVTGADLKKRIVRIMTAGASRKMDFGKKLFLGTAGFLAFAVPVAFGLAYAAPRVASRGRHSQNASANLSEYKYEVASIKPTKSNPNSHHSDTTDDELRAVNISLMRLIRQAYLLQFGPAGDDGRVVGGPSWVDSDGFDLDAKMDSATADAVNKLRPIERETALQQMIQAVLKERFKLVVHGETKEFPVYVLTLAKNGPKLHEAKAGDTYENAYKKRDGSPAGAGFHSDEARTVAAQGVSSGDLAQWLSRRVGRTVVDRTGLTGKYDFTLNWPSDDSENTGDPSLSPIFAAIQQQLGLKLESGKGPVEIIVIDHAERPSGN
jgi:bla regulator protein blaR1